MSCMYFDLTLEPIWLTLVCSPSNRVAAAKRKLLLVNDNQVKSFTARKVVCKKCSTSVDLEGEGDYNLTAWEAHKDQCTK